MNNKRRSAFKVLTQLGLVLAATAATVVPAQAFEERALAKGYRMIVGFAHEDETPPAAGVPTGLSVFVGHDNPTTGETDILDTDLGDEVVLTSIALRLKSDQFNAKVLEAIPMLKPFVRVDDEDINPGYEQAFTPKKAGAYGFFISGLVKKKGYAPLVFLQKFVCGNGSQDTEPGADSIRCVAEAPPAP